MVGLLCEGRSSDLPFLVRVLVNLLSCTPESPSTPFPLDPGRGWTKVRTTSGRLVGIRAAGSYEKILEALPAVAVAAAANEIALGVVVDLDTSSIGSRQQAVQDRIKASRVSVPPKVTVLGMGLPTSTVPVSPSQNLDQIVTEIILGAQPALTGVLSNLISAVTGLGQLPTWKLATCALAGSLGKEDGEAIYHHSVAGFTTQAQKVLSQAGILSTLATLIA